MNYLAFNDDALFLLKVCSCGCGYKDEGYDGTDDGCMGARETQPTHLCDGGCQKLHHETETQGGVQAWPYESSSQYRSVADNSVSTIKLNEPIMSQCCMCLNCMPHCMVCNMKIPNKTVFTTKLYIINVLFAFMCVLCGSS